MLVLDWQHSTVPGGALHHHADQQAQRHYRGFGVVPERTRPILTDRPHRCSGPRPIERHTTSSLTLASTPKKLYVADQGEWRLRSQPDPPIREHLLDVIISQPGRHRRDLRRRAPGRRCRAGSAGHAGPAPRPSSALRRPRRPGPCRRARQYRRQGDDPQSVGTEAVQHRQPGHQQHAQKRKPQHADAQASEPGQTEAVEGCRQGHQSTEGDPRARIAPRVNSSATLRSRRNLRLSISS